MALRCASKVVHNSSKNGAPERAADELLQELGGSPDLLLSFFSGSYAERLATVYERVLAQLRPQTSIGCTADSLIGTRVELEHEDAISIWGARLPNSRLTSCHFELHRSPEGPVIVGWPDSWRSERSPEDFLLLLGEPFSFPTDVLLERLAEDHPDLTVIGGMAARGFSPGSNRLMLNDRIVEQGAVAVLVQGGVQLTSVLSQGCRPIGRPWVVTKADRNELLELGGRPALEVLREVFVELPTREQQAVNEGLLIGRVIDEYKREFGMGDFLVRGVVGLDPERKSIAVTDYMKAGQTVQFHIRDQASAHEELEQMLGRIPSQPPPVGGLIFSCNGRGTHMFSQDGHDAQCVANRFGDLPLAGFFAAGEIGPVGGRAFVHGFTASMALLRDASPATL